MEKTAIETMAARAEAFAHLALVRETTEKALMDVLKYGTSAPFIYHDDAGESLAHALQEAAGR